MNRRRDVHDTVSDLQKQEHDRSAFNEAQEGLAGEAAEWARQNPGQARALYRDLAAQQLRLMDRLERYKPADPAEPAKGGK